VARARVFIDFWNFQLGWNDRSLAQCDWPRVPGVLVAEAETVLRAGSGLAEPLVLDETIVHASVNPQSPNEVNLRRWLTSFLDRQPSFNVSIHERRVRPASIYCPNCGTKHETCPECGTPYARAPEKGVDSAIVTDMLSLANQSAFDVGILVTGDADLVPAVDRIQQYGLKVINAGWRGVGFDLQHTCWGSLALDPLIPLLERSPSES